LYISKSCLFWRRADGDHNEFSMDHMRFDATHLKPARQPEAVAAGFEGNREPRDLLSGPDRLIPPLMHRADGCRVQVTRSLGRGLAALPGLKDIFPAEGTQNREANGWCPEHSRADGALVPSVLSEARGCYGEVRDRRYAQGRRSSVWSVFVALTSVVHSDMHDLMHAYKQLHRFDQVFLPIAYLIKACSLLFRCGSP
jgi:hypothetical protein